MASLKIFFQKNPKNRISFNLKTAAVSSNSSLEDIYAIIKQKLSFYVDAITAKNIDKMMSIFSEDSILIGPPVEAHGREAIKQILGDLIKPIISGDIFSKHIFQITEEAPISNRPWESRFWYRMTVPCRGSWWHQYLSLSLSCSSHPWRDQDLIHELC